MSDQQTTPEPQWEECPYCPEYHPVGTSEQCPEKPATNNDLEMSADQFFYHLQADMETAGDSAGEAEIVGIITDQAEAARLFEPLMTLLSGKQGGRES